MVVSPVRAAACAETFQSSYSGPTCRWQSINPGKTSLPVASITRSAAGRNSSGASATMRPFLIATHASTTSLAVTTRPPLTIRSTARAVALICLRGGPRHGPPRPPTLGAPRETRDAPRPCARSSVRLLLRDGVQERPVMLRLTPAEEVPALAHRRHLIRVDARHDQLVAGGRRLGDDLAERVDHAAAPDQLDTVLDSRLGHAHHEARVGVGARAHAEVVEVQRERGDGGVVADENDLGALQGERAVALRIAAILADGDADLRARAVPHAVARVAMGEVVGLVDLREAVGRLGAGQVDLAERAAEPAVAVGQQRRVPVLALRLLAEADMHRDPRLRRAPQQRLQRLRRHLALEELVEVAANLLGEVRRQRHLGVRDQLNAVTGRALQENEHALDDLLARRAFVVGAHLGGGDLYLARHAGSFACPRDGRGGAPC